jgi:hypothetical protein
VSTQQRNELNFSHRVCALLGLIAGVAWGENVRVWGWYIVLATAVVIVAAAIRAVRNEEAAAVSTEKDPVNPETGGRTDGC